MNRFNFAQALTPLAASLALLSACTDSAKTETTAMMDNKAKAETATTMAPAPVVDPVSRRALFGDLHLHTGNSFDAASSATNTTPEDAYRFAQGEAVEYFGRPVQRQAPLDFLAVTDHAEYLGVAKAASDPQGPFSDTSWPADLAEKSKNVMDFMRVFSTAGFRGAEPIPEFVTDEVITTNWQNQMDAAEKYYRPGEFTTFVAFEWSPMPGGAHMHRNVIFKGPDFPEMPYSAIESMKPEDLWTYAEAQIDAGRDLVLIPHNSNLSHGLMFAFKDSYGNDLTAAYAQRRSRLERLVEITQNKGTSETRPEFSPTDEFAGFELLEWGVGDEGVDLAGGFVRTAFKRGLQLQESLGSNPFVFGLIGSSDFHSGLTSAEEFNFPGGLGSTDEQTDPNRVLTSINPVMGTPTTVMSASGLTGVWAEENTRESIFAALKRREVFATSGPRMQVRLFAGDYPEGMTKDSNWVNQAYEKGVAMGSDLPSGQVPRFILQALKDPDSGNIDRIQVVKIWLEDGEAREKVFDALWAGDRQVDPDTGKLPPVGNTVDTTTATFTNTIGAVSLIGEWSDPEFDPGQAAIYYARVLEIPTPRWSTYLAVNNGLPLSKDVPATLQERAWTSPVFHNP